MGDPLLLIAGILMVVIGIAGIIIPGLPGVVLVYLGLFFVAWSDGFARVGWITLTILLLIGAVAWLIDLFTTVYGARRIGASRWAAVGAALGMLIGRVDFKNLQVVLKEAYTNEAGQEMPAVAIRYGMLVNTVIEFLIVALSVFVIVKFMNRLIRKREEPQA